MARKSLGNFKAILCKNGEQKCHYCGTDLVFGKKQKGANFATVDHVIPKKENGENKLSNFVLCCSLCNSLKGHMSYDKFSSLISSVEERDSYYDTVKNKARIKKENRHMMNVYKLATFLFHTKIEIHMSYELRLLIEEIS